MSYNQRYWIGKEERAKIAEEHTKKMASKYANEMHNSYQHTVVYSNGSQFSGDCNTGTPAITLVDMTSEMAVKHYHDGKTAVLNFASYKNPGGGFLAGSSAQEESLCHVSTLYNVLVQCNSYYEWNRQHLNNAMYTNRALYSPNIVFEYNNETVIADVITCASPNWSAANRYHRVSASDNNESLSSRIAFIKAIAEMQHVNTLILGAFGAGVFGQDAEKVASIMKETFSNTTISHIVYAVPKLKDASNYNAFEKIFGK